MARQTGILPLTGTIGGITFYRMQGAYYARSKSSLDKKRIYRDKAFTRTLQNARWFGRAVTLAREVYRQNFERSNKNRIKVWYPLRNRAQELVREGVEEVEIRRKLYEEFVAGRGELRGKQKQCGETGSTSQEIRLNKRMIKSDQYKQLWEELMAYKTLLENLMAKANITLTEQAFVQKPGKKILTE